MPIPSASLPQRPLTFRAPLADMVIHCCKQHRFRIVGTVDVDEYDRVGRICLVNDSLRPNAFGRLEGFPDPGI